MYDKEHEDLDKEMDTFLDFLIWLSDLDKKEKEKKKEEPVKEEKKEEKKEPEKVKEKEKPVEPSAKMRVMAALQNLRSSVDGLEAAIEQYVPKVTEERTGMWKVDTAFNSLLPTLRCSECFSESYGGVYYRYCPYCGVKMKNARRGKPVTNTVSKEKDDWLDSIISALNTKD